MSSSDSKIPLGKRQRQKPPHAEERDEVKNLLQKLQLAGKSAAEIGAMVGVSRQAVETWISGKSHPRWRNILDLRRAWETVHFERTKFAQPTEQASKDEAAGVASTVPADTRKSSLGEWVETMGTQIAWRELQAGRSRYAALEVCVIYNADLIKAGIVTDAAIDIARAGQLEDQGCHLWDPKQWWDGLQAVQKKIDGIFGPPRRSGSGTIASVSERTHKKALP